jgi:hypothetical protein
MQFINRLVIVTLALVTIAGPALGATTHAKAKKVAKKAAPPAPAAPVDHSAGALASCKQHVENMLKSPSTQFDNESSLHVLKADEQNFDVAGGVHSANAIGKPIGGNFNCHAQLIGGAVWSTKTSLDFAR